MREGGREEERKEESQRGSKEVREGGREEGRKRVREGGTK